MKAKLRFDVLKRDGFRCRYCGRSAPDVTLEVDHVKPRARGGTDDPANLVTACFACNRGKRAVLLPVGVCGFLTWLRQQQCRDDIVGDLADDESHKPLRNVTSYGDLARQLRQAGVDCTEVHAAAWHAWREFQRGEPTRAVRRMQTELAARIRGLQPGHDVHTKSTWHCVDVDTGERYAWPVR